MSWDATLFYVYCIDLVREKTGTTMQRNGRFEKKQQYDHSGIWASLDITY